ncbi:MAG: RecQ family ATP-dependent DNA helicase [Pirellulales bacterium]|nr:RecQ family ATP-dependent DNA helicase [Pirellulales bacterium]
MGSSPLPIWQLLPQVLHCFMDDNLPQPEEILPRFGLTSFRPGQREVINTVFSGRDCLCVMPTGGGKSLCYQLPAIAREGVVLVVSPLIALMQDQVEQLTALGLRATFVNSAINSQEQAARLDQMAAGEFDLVYVAAERFRSSRFLEAAAQSGLQLLAIDEAHCISEWGHDFRPDYARLGHHRAKLGNPATIALTATATAEVRRDIAAQLNLTDPEVFVTGFARPNLHMAVTQQRSRRGKDKALVDFVRKVTSPGIVYTATRKTCEETAELLNSETRLKTVHYHGGMQTEDRTAAQDEFMSGRADVVVATTAFGMGIDKANVRFVLHYHIPGSLEAYYQEAGRAGRDGEDSHCLLLYARRDAEIQEFFIENSYPEPRVVANVWEFLRRQEADPIELTQQEIKDQLHLSIGNEGVRACEHLLERGGVLERMESNQNLGMVRLSSPLPSMVDYLPKQATVRRRVLQAIEKMVTDERGEMYSFSPRQLASALGLDYVSLTRHLRELAQLDDFEYVPPFRGRAIRLLRPELSFSELELDFDTLEKRKRQEYAKLARMQSYANNPGCRQSNILEYFGQQDRTDCGACDNCETSDKRPALAKTSDSTSTTEESGLATVAVRIALSGVARTKGRFGRTVVAQMLCGSTAAKMTKFRLTSLSTYGRLGFLRQEQVADLLDDLVDAGLVEQVDVDKHRPVVRLSVAGSETMRGERTLPTSLALNPQVLMALRMNRSQLPAVPTPTQPAVSSKMVDNPETDDSFTRDSFAEVSVTDLNVQYDEDSAVPSFSDRETKHDLPPRESSASQLVANREERTTAAQQSGSVRQSDDGQVNDSHYWTWRLFKAGFTPFECAQIRNLELEVIRDHAFRAAQAGLTVELTWFLSAEKIAAMEDMIGDSNPKRIRPLLSELPRGTRFEDVQLYLACRAAQTAESAVD